MKIEMTYLSAVNFAMQQNRVPVIRELRIHNQTGRDLANVTVTVTPEPPFASLEQVNIGAMAADETQTLDNVRLNLQPNFFVQMTEGVAGEIDEYQSRNVNRVRHQMAAIYAALAEQNIAYVSVPASFGAAGQRIRLVDAVLANRLGNCIDLSLLFALHTRHLVRWGDLRRGKNRARPRDCAEGNA